MELQIMFFLLMAILILECFGLPSAHHYPHNTSSRYSQNIPSDVPLRMESEDRKVYHWIQEGNCNECGRLPLKTGYNGRRSGRIVKGTPVIPPNKYPWMVAIASSKESKDKICGGVIISANFILTAAHCFRRSKTFDKESGGICHNYVTGTFELCYLKKDEVFVQLLTDTYDTREGLPVAEILLHPMFQVSTGLWNDIALLRLSHPIQCNEYAIPICLPLSETNILVGTPVVVTGWGRTHPFLTSVYPRALHEGIMTVVDQIYCPKTYELESWFCLSGGGRLTTCFGDSGGPMMYEMNGKIFTLGVLSRLAEGVLDTCFPEDRSVYTRVQHFLSWIYNVLYTSPNRAQKSLN